MGRFDGALIPVGSLVCARDEKSPLGVGLGNWRWAEVRTWTAIQDSRRTHTLQRKKEMSKTVTKRAVSLWKLS